MAAIGGPAQLDGPPPSPVLNPEAASNSSKLQMLTGGAAPGQPGGPGSAGAPAGAQNDMAGVLALGQKISEAILTLSQAMPAQAGQLDQGRELIENAIAQFLQTSGGTGTSPTAPMQAAPPAPGAPPANAGPPVTQSGTQFPGGGFGAGRIS